MLQVDPHTQRVPRSQRGGEIIEPLVSSQWFVKTEGMGAKALKAVEDGDIKIVPERFNKIWYNWLGEIRDWCVSRQLWWGHRIPVWYVGPSGESEYIVARSEADARKQAIENGHPEDVILRQEEDVLDTWFSSGLWPFATVGWPKGENDPNSDLSRFYPGTCLETGYDILFFWVARMAMMGIELTGKSPFSVVYLHGLVRAADGTKMSKTKGNVVDPLDTVAEYGADSLRYSLVTGVTPGQDIPLNMEKIAANKSFANKLWNCCKFVTDNALKEATEEEKSALGVDGPMSQEEFDALPVAEKYIISKCHKLVADVTSEIERYQLGAAGSKVRIHQIGTNSQHQCICTHYLTQRFRFTSSFGTNTLIGTLRYQRPDCTRGTEVAQKRLYPQEEYWFTFWISVCVFSIHTCLTSLNIFGIISQEQILLPTKLHMLLCLQTGLR